jgi:hypothetical protein
MARRLEELDSSSRVSVRRMLDSFFFTAEQETAATTVHERQKG